MSVLPQFNPNLTNSYTGDAFSELVRSFNTHKHSQASTTNFLAYPLLLNAPVSFLGLSQSAPDPFSGFSNSVPLVISAVAANTLTLSRAANVDTLVALTYQNPITNSYEIIENLQVTNGSNQVTFNLAIDRTGFVAPALLNSALTRYLIADAQISATGSNSTPTLPLATVIDITTTASGYYNLSDYAQPNPTLSLVRGQSYVLSSNAAVILAGGFNLVTQVRAPALGLLKVTQGLVITSNALQTYTVPYDAPSQLFYQSASQPALYGSISITGGIIPTPPGLWQPNQSQPPQIPTQIPHQITMLSLSAVSNYRITKLNIYPHWTLPNNPKDAYIQLVVANTAGIARALSSVIKLDTLDPAAVTALSNQIISSNDQVYCAIYAPVNLSRLSFQLTILDLINA
jgi:hypothetical protein